MFDKQVLEERNRIKSHNSWATLGPENIYKKKHYQLELTIFLDEQDVQLRQLGYRQIQQGTQGLVSSRNQSPYIGLQYTEKLQLPEKNLA